jgi:hypothetical protein
MNYVRLQKLASQGGFTVNGITERPALCCNDMDWITTPIGVTYADH